MNRRAFIKTIGMVAGSLCLPAAVMGEAAGSLFGPRVIDSMEKWLCREMSANLFSYSLSRMCLTDFIRKGGSIIAAQGTT